MTTSLSLLDYLLSMSDPCSFLVLATLMTACWLIEKQSQGPSCSYEYDRSGVAASEE